MKRLLVALGGLALVVLLASPAATPIVRPKTNAAGLRPYDVHALQHTDLAPIRQAHRTMLGENLPFPAGQSANAAAVAAATPTLGVDQDGVCDAPTQQVGTQKTFWVHDYKLDANIQKTFVLAAVTDHVYMWVDVAQDGVVVAREQALAAAEAFDQIRTTNRSYFGHEAGCGELPYREPPRMRDIWGGPWYDADDDVHINIVNFDIDAGASYVAGYYSPGDEYPKQDAQGNPINPQSNEGEFFYMNSVMVDVGSEDYLGVLAHEFYHMIQFANDANEDSWVNEGMADVAIEVNSMGDLTSGHTSEYANNPGDQLTHWNSELTDYGNAYSFFSYFLSHYGPSDDPATPFKENYALAQQITQVEADGLAGVDDVLAGNPYKAQLNPYYAGRTAEGVYLDRSVANVVNDRSAGAGQYGFYAPLEAFRVNPTGSANGPGSGTGSGRTFGDQVFVLDSAADGAFTVDGSPTIPVVPNTPTSGTHELWSNRVDETLTFAQRTATLPAGGAPHLRFNYWYSLEEDFDYGYLRVSDDGGQTWTNVACCGSRTTNPNGNNRGNGFSGNSGATTLDATPKWQAADVDLSAWAGKTVTIRFEYVTDPAVNEPGLTIDDVDLVDGASTIWPKATFESGLDGFTVGGSGAPTFLRITPDSPNELVLQLVKTGRGITVSRHDGADAGSVVRATGGADAFRTYAIFTSLTPITSEEYDYSWTAGGSVLNPLVPATLTATGGSSVSLSWTPAGNAGVKPPERYDVQESPYYTRHLSDDAEAGLGQWQSSIQPLAGVGTPTPWQQSPAKKRSGTYSFFTVAPDTTFAASSMLTYKQPISLPAGQRSTLTFWDWANNEPDDATLVEVSEDGGSTWQTAWTASRGSDATVAAGDAAAPLAEQAVNLSAWAGKTIRLRFRYFVGDFAYYLYAPLGWYVDDIELVSADWKTIAEPTGTSLTVPKSQSGTFHYRVGAVYTPFAVGPWSNVASAEVRLQPDLALAAGDLAFSSTRVRGGDRVTITATVHNLGAAAAANVVVRFDDNGVAFGGDQTISSIPPGGTGKATVVWDTKGLNGPHTIRATADPNGAVVEDNEANNAVIAVVTVQGNKVKNGSFEQSSASGSSPDGWSGSSTGAGSASYSQSGGTEGSGAASLSGNGGNALAAGSPTWTSDPVAVSAGQVLDLVASVKATGSSSAPSVGLVYLGAAGQLVNKVTVLTSPLTTTGFQTLEQAVTIPAGVTQVRVVLSGFAPTDLFTTGTVTFDDVGLFAR
jgi:immune inhibitor A